MENGYGSKAVTEAERTKPDVILMDISMPELSGIKAVRQILPRFPEMKIIMLSMYNKGIY